MSSTPSRYDEIAQFYEAFAPDAYDDSVTAALLSLVGEVSGLSVLDLACGHGRLSRELARRGAHVTGVDISAPLVDKGRALEQQNPLGIEYVHADAALPGTLGGEVFDGVACHFGLSDIDDLDGAVATVGRVLVPGGFFAFSILHPCFPGWESRGANPSWPPARGYFEEGWWVADGPPGGVRPRVGANHRMLSTYVNTLATSRLAIEKMVEPEPGQDWLNVAPAIGPVPVYLVVRCRKV